MIFTEPTNTSSAQRICFSKLLIQCNYLNSTGPHNRPMPLTADLNQTTGVRQSSEPDVPETSWVQVILR